MISAAARRLDVGADVSPVDTFGWHLVVDGVEAEPLDLSLKQRKQLDAWCREEAIRTAPPTIEDHSAYNGRKTKPDLRLFTVPKPSWLNPAGAERCPEARRDVGHRRPKSRRGAVARRTRAPSSDDGPGEPARPGNRANVVTSLEQVEQLLEAQAAKGHRRREIAVTCGSCFSRKRGAHAGLAAWWVEHTCNRAVEAVVFPSPRPLFSGETRLGDLAIPWKDCGGCGFATTPFRRTRSELARSERMHGVRRKPEP